MPSVDLSAYLLALQQLCSWLSALGWSLAGLAALAYATAVALELRREER